MSMFSRFFGRKDEDPADPGKLVANPAIEEPLSLQLLFDDLSGIDEQRLTDALRATDKTMSGARAELDEACCKQGTPLGLLGWGKHVIQLVGFNTPMPEQAVEVCVAPAHYGADMKERARAHRANVILYYKGFEDSSMEQYVALGAAAGALARVGAIAVLNESAHTSLPAALLADADHGDDLTGFLRESLPLLLLFCGFVKYKVEDTPGIWMRTYGAHLLGLPDLAMLTTGHDQGEAVYGMFSNIFSYLIESGATFSAGDTMQVGRDEYMRLREPVKEEDFLESEGKMFVAEIITEAEINRPHGQADVRGSVSAP